MKNKNASIVISMVCLSIITCWFVFHNKLAEDVEWLGYILVVPLVFFVLNIFSKSTSEKPVKAIISITAGVITSCLLSNQIILFSIIGTLIGSTITFLVNKIFISKS
jgi:hypothetical protein